MTSPRWTRWLLGLSLGLNVVLLAIVAAMGAGSRDPRGQAPEGTSDPEVQPGADPGAALSTSGGAVRQAAPPPSSSPEAATRRGWRPAARGDGGIAARYPQSLVSTCSLEPGTHAVVEAQIAATGERRIEQVRGELSESQRRCLEREVREQGVRGNRERYESVIIHSDGSISTQESPTPPLYERHLAMPGVDPFDVASSCAFREETGCIRRALEGQELGAAQHDQLLWAFAHDGDYEAVRAYVDEVGSRYENAGWLDAYQALLWRLDHGLSPGRVRRRSLFGRPTF